MRQYSPSPVALVTAVVMWTNFAPSAPDDTLQAPNAELFGAEAANLLEQQITEAVSTERRIGILTSFSATRHRARGTCCLVAFSVNL